MKALLSAFLAGCAAGAVAVPAFAEIYKWTDPDGSVHYGDQRPAGRNAESVEVRPAAAGVGMDAPLAGAPPEILLYATRSCGYCKKTRALLERRGLSWQEIDIESSPAARAEFRSRGGTGVPLLIIDGQALQGFNEAALSATLARYGY